MTLTSAPKILGMLAVATGADKPACVTNIDCDPGQFCMTRGITTSAAQTKACVMCLCEPPMWDEGWPARSKCGWVYTVGEESKENQRGEEQASARGEYTVVDPTPRALFTNVSAAEFCANQPEHGANPNFAAGCDGCYNPAAQAWSGRSKIEGLRDAVAKMRGGDWLALVVCLMMFGMHLGQEMSDIHLCDMISRQRQGKKRSWLVLAMSIMRGGVVLQLGTSWHRGSDALSVAFNLVAILFFLGESLIILFVGNHSILSA